MGKDLEGRVSDLETRIGIIEENDIIDDLTAERFPGSGKPLYSYDDIAQKRKIPKSRVQDVAKRNNLERRSKRNA